MPVKGVNTMRNQVVGTRSLVNKGITFAIHPDTQIVTVSLFQRVLAGMVRFVLDVDYAVTRERNPRRWIISELRSSNPTITIAPILDDARTVDAILSGVQAVISGEVKGPPDYFNEQALYNLKNMHHLFIGHDRARKLVLGSNGDAQTVIDSGINEKVERLLIGGYWNLGSVEGYLDALNLHGQAMFTVWDRVSNAAVRCYFPREPAWKERVKNLLEKRVLVTGKVNYFRNGMPRSVTDIEAIIDSTPNTSLPPAEFGCIPDREAATDPAAFLRRVRVGE